MAVPRLKRYSRVTYHLKGGQSVSQLLRDLEIRTQHNDLVSVTRRFNGSDRCFYLRLDAVDCITFDKAWRFYIAWGAA